MLKNSPEKYGTISKILHWGIALLVLALIALGWYMTSLDYYHPWRHRTLSLHKSVGVLVFILFMIKILWLIKNPTPKISDKLKKWERIAAWIVHKFLFAIICILPITGYIMSTSSGSSISFFGMFEIAPLFTAGENARDISENIHEIIAYSTLAVAILHIAAALKHHFIDKDDTLKKML